MTACSSVGALVLCMMVITVSGALLVRIWTTNAIATTPTFLRGRSSRSLVYAGADSLDASDARRSTNALALCMAFTAAKFAVPTRSWLHSEHCHNDRLLRFSAHAPQRAPTPPHATKFGTRSKTRCCVRRVPP